MSIKTRDHTSTMGQQQAAKTASGVFGIARKNRPKWKNAK